MFFNGCIKKSINTSNISSSMDSVAARNIIGDRTSHKYGRSVVFKIACGLFLRNEQKVGSSLFIVITLFAGGIELLLASRNSPFDNFINSVCFCESDTSGLGIAENESIFNPIVPIITIITKQFRKLFFERVMLDQINKAMLGNTATHI